MKRFADSLVRQKGIKPPPGYKTSISICRKFLSEHVPKNAQGETTGKLDPKPVSPAQLLYAKKLAQGKGLIIPDDVRTNSAAISAWIDANRGKKRRKNGRKTTFKPAEPVAPQSAAPPKRSRKRKADTDVVPPAPASANSVTVTPLRIPYGNKEVALKLPVMAQGDGMPRLELIFLHSANGGGCNARGCSAASHMGSTPAPVGLIQS
jgi:DNA topoisomerase-3